MSYQEISDKRVKARKVYKCSWCGQEILTGELHDSRVFKYDGEMKQSREHIGCTTKMLDDHRDEPDFEYELYVNERGVLR